jgi:hypothetical protein
MKQDGIKSFSDIPLLPRKPAEDRERDERLHSRDVPRSRRRPKECVVNSEDIKWKPVDIVTRRVVAAAKWYEEPPRPDPKFVKQEFPEPPRVKSKRTLTEDGYVKDQVELQSLAPAALEHHEQHVKEGLKASETLLERSHDIIDGIDYLAKEIRGPWDEYEAFVKQALAQVREQRIALGSETRLLLSALRDVRAFFLDKDYEQEISRLRDFVDICERLQALKKSGTLDAVADTILKLNA